MIDIITNIIGTRALLVLAAVLLVIDIGQCVTLKIQNVRLEAVKTEKQTLTVQLQQVGAQIAAQNGAIDQMLANAAKAADRLHAAEAEAGKVRVVTQERVRIVETAAIPVTCPEAVVWGAEHAVEIGKRWEKADER